MDVRSSRLVHWSRRSNASCSHVPGVRYWGYRWYVWNNSGGDAATLRTASGAVVDTCTYTGPGSVTSC